MGGYYAFPGQNLFGMHRTGSRIYTSRPPANCRRARQAWDKHSKSGEIKQLRLLDGYWGALFVDGELRELENI